MMEAKRYDPSQWVFQKAGPVQHAFLRQHVDGLNSIFFNVSLSDSFHKQKKEKLRIKIIKQGKKLALTHKLKQVD